MRRQARGIAEFLQSLPDRVFSRKALGFKIAEPFFQMIPQFIRDRRFLRGVQPEEFAQKGKEKIEIFIRHGSDCPRK